MFGSIEFCRVFIAAALKIKIRKFLFDPHLISLFIMFCSKNLLSSIFVILNLFMYKRILKSYCNFINVIKLCSYT